MALQPNSAQVSHFHRVRPCRWGLGLLLYELCLGVALFAGAKEGAHFGAMAGGALPVELAAIRLPSLRHLVAKLVRLEPTERCSLEATAHHAYLAGGLDTVELSESFQGLQTRQEAMQHEMAKIEAELLRRDKLRAEEEERARRYADQKQRRDVMASGARQAVFTAASKTR